MKITAVVVAVLCLVVGFAAGLAVARSNARTDLDEVRFARTLGSISTSTTTLLMLAERRPDKIQMLHEGLLREYARDARETAPAARHVGARVKSIDESLGRTIAYAQRRGMKDTVADLSAIRQVVRSAASR